MISDAQRGSVVLDASALLALFYREAGGDEVASRLPGAIVGAVNIAEVVGKLADGGLAEEEVRLAIDALHLDVVSMDETVAWECGLLRPRTRAAGLSLGDRACLALAKVRGLPVLTADRAWLGIDVGVAVLLIR